MTTIFHAIIDQLGPKNINLIGRMWLDASSCKFVLCTCIKNHAYKVFSSSSFLLLMHSLFPLRAYNLIYDGFFELILVLIGFTLTRRVGTLMVHGVGLIALFTLLSSFDQLERYPMQCSSSWHLLNSCLIVWPWPTLFRRICFQISESTDHGCNFVELLATLLLSRSLQTRSCCTWVSTS